MAFSMFQIRKWTMVAVALLLLAAFGHINAVALEKRCHSEGSDEYYHGHSSGHSSGHGSGHSSGHGSGHSSGHSSGYSSGHSSGHGSGHSSGYSSGYSGGQGRHHHGGCGY